MEDEVVTETPLAWLFAPSRRIRSGLNEDKSVVKERERQFCAREWSLAPKITRRQRSPHSVSLLSPNAGWNHGPLGPIE